MTLKINKASFIGKNDRQPSVLRAAAHLIHPYFPDANKKLATTCTKSSNEHIKLKSSYEYTIQNLIRAPN
jgi:hypothetical protein